MKSGFLKSSTAIVLVASLAAAPAPSFAQTADGDAAQSEDTDAELLRQQLESATQGDAEAEVEAEGAAPSEEPVPSVTQDTPADVVPDAAEADANSETEAPSETVEDAPAQEAEAEAEPTAETAQPNTAPADEPAAESVESEPAPEATEPESAASEQAAEPDSAPAEGPAADTADSAPETAEPTVTESEAETPSETLPEAAETEAAQEPDAVPETAQDAPADTEGVAGADSDVATDPEATTPESGTAAQTTQTEDSAQDAQETVITEDAAPMDSEAQAEIEAAADADASASMAAAGAGGEGEPEVVEETVTEDTARSSDEEFTTDLQGEARADTQARKKDDDDDNGLSNFEKAALLGVGAVAVGSLLRRNETVAANTGDRVVAEQNGQYRIIKNDDALLRQPGSDIKTFNYSDGSTRTIVLREDGTEVETIRAADGRVLRRARTLPDGSTALLFDDTQSSRAVEVSTLPQISTRRMVDIGDIDADDLEASLTAAQAANVNRTFSLSQIRNINAVRQLVPEINVDSVNFETNSAVIRPDEAEELAALGNAMRRMIERNPSEVFLVEGHTDAVGAGSYNLALSDRRAESVALALTEYFDVPPENLVVQGYGESDLIVRTAGAERSNRRAAVRRITPLLDGSNT